MKQYLLSGAIAAVVAAGASWATLQLAAPPPQQLLATALVAAQASPYAWPELTQQQVNDLTAQLGKLNRRDVAIYCLHACAELALSLDNAFETAKWRSGVETPLVDDNVGVFVGPRNDPDAKNLQAALAATTGLRPELIDAENQERRLVLVIGRKPRA